MKFKTLLFLPIALIGMAQFSSFGQEKEKTRIIIKSDNNGKVTTKEMLFDKKMTQVEIDKLMAENRMDSTQVKVLKKNKKITVTVDENGNKNVEESDSRDYDDYSFEENFPAKKNYQFRSPKIAKEEFKRRGRYFIDEFPNKAQRVDEFFIETFSNTNEQVTVKNAEIFSNNPRSEFLNVKFRVSKKDKITLTLVDLAGKIVAQDFVQDFIGDYFGQMKVDKNLKGNFILIISQADYGESLKVNLK